MKNSSTAIFGESKAALFSSNKEVKSRKGVRGADAITCQYGVAELLIRHSLSTHFHVERKQFGQANEVAVYNCGAQPNGNSCQDDVSHFHVILASHHDARQKFEHREGERAQRNIVSIQVLDWVQ